MTLPGELEGVPLRHAFAWDCPKCGREQLGNLMSPPAMSGSLPDDVCGFWIPDEVECASCGHHFATLLHEDLPDIMEDDK